MSIVQVARLAGVSNATVSRVINNHPTVQPDMVKAVQAAIAELQYAPSPRRRRGPKAKLQVEPARSSTFTMLVLGLSADRATPGFEDMMHGLFEAAEHWGVKLLLHNATSAEALSDLLAGSSFDGLLLHGTPSSATLSDRLRAYPTVWLMADRKQPDWGDQVMPDMYEVGDRAARYLLARGHRHLAFFNMDRANWSVHLTRQSFASAAVRAGAACALLETGGGDQLHGANDTEAADLLVQQFLKFKHRPTGILVADDMQLAVIQPALQQAGIEFGPGKLEVVSCNNERSYLAGLSPFPAEISICADAVGFQGVEQLLWRLKNQDVPERMITCVEPKLLDPSGKPIDPSALVS